MRKIGWLALLASCASPHSEEEGAGKTSYVSMGMAQIELGHYDEAIRLLTIAIQNAPDDPDAYLHRGNAWLAKQDADRAIFDYGESVRVAPHYKKGYFQRGYTLYSLVGDFDAALEDFTDAIKCDERYGDAYLYRGQVYRALKVFNSAVADMEAALREGLSTEERRALAERWLAETRQQAAGH
jgi:tetratricopeptide (TPR) repeat protein